MDLIERRRPATRRPRLPHLPATEAALTGGDLLELRERWLALSQQAQAANEQARAVQSELVQQRAVVSSARPGADWLAVAAAEAAVRHLEPAVAALQKRAIAANDDVAHALSRFQTSWSRYRLIARFLLGQSDQAPRSQTANGDASMQELERELTVLIGRLEYPDE